jgi:acetyl esterase/lipase
MEHVDCPSFTTKRAMSFSTVFYRVFVLTVGMTSIGCASLRSHPSARVAGSPRATEAARPAPAERADAAPTYPVHQELDVVYGRGGEEELRLDLFVPKQVSGPLPALVILHGGGWAKGSHEAFRPIASAFAAHGYVTATVGYRFAPRHAFPAQIHDAKCAVRWLRANAERYQIDRDHVGALGFSAGAHLALLLGLTEAKDGLEGDGGNAEQSSRVQAVINVSGPTDLTRPGWSPPIEGAIADFMGGGRQQIANAYWTASPLAYVHRGAPPVLTIHGTDDPVVPYEQAQLLQASLRKAKVSARLIPLHGKGHGDNWTPQNMQRCKTAILEFLDANLRPR